MLIQIAENLLVKKCWSGWSGRWSQHVFHCHCQMCCPQIKTNRKNDVQVIISVIIPPPLPQRLVNEVYILLG